MTDIKSKLGKTLLEGLVSVRERNGDVSLEDMGDIFMNMASDLNPSHSKADEFMHQEIARLAKYITEAKNEIFSISTNDKSEQVIMDASAHLDEVIKATEEATNMIMDAADAVQAAAAGIGGDKETAIIDATTRIYNACTFQDITGQRINKVIKLLANIEERVGKLNDLFGSELPDPSQIAQKDSNVVVQIHDKDLLNGPQLASQASSQSDIDALFSSLGGKS
jgi:chemotaxis protein CheZ